jgi:hypothetical protein
MNINDLLNLEHYIPRLVPPALMGQYAWVHFEVLQPLYVDENGWQWMVCNGSTIGNETSGADLASNKLFKFFSMLHADPTLPLRDNLGIPISNLRSLETLVQSWEGSRQISVPDVRDRKLIKHGASHTFGDRGGSETITLTEAQLPSHSHDATLQSQD